MMAQHQKQSMREHLEAVQQVVTAAANGDFAGVEKAARPMGYTEQMGRMCSHMGAGAVGFSERALEFHHSADKIADVARTRDLPAVMRALSVTLATCTGCHAAFKQQVALGPLSGENASVP
jgi:cytochrome c556